MSARLATPFSNGIRVAANWPAIYATVADYNGQIGITTDGSFGVYRSGVGTTQQNWQAARVSQASIDIFQEISSGPITGGRALLTAVSGAHHIYATTAYQDNVIYLKNTSGGYCAIACYDEAGVEAAAFGFADADTGNTLAGRLYFEAGNNAAANNADVRAIRFRQYATFSSTLYDYARLDFQTDGDVIFWQLVPGSDSDAGTGEPTSPVALYIQGNGGNVGIGTSTVVTFAAAGGKTLHILGAADFPGILIEQTGVRKWGIGQGNASESNALLFHNQTAGITPLRIHGTAQHNSIFIAPNDVQFGSGIKMKRTATATDYTVLQTDHIIGVTSTASARVVTLPSAVTSGAGKEYIVKDESGAAGTNNITVKSAAGTLDGVAAATGVPITTNGGVSRWFSDGANWFSW